MSHFKHTCVALPTFEYGDVLQGQRVLPVLQAEVLCDGVEDVHLVPQLGLRVDVSHPQAAGVLRNVADLNLDNTDGVNGWTTVSQCPRTLKDRPACHVSSTGES